MTETNALQLLEEFSSQENKPIFEKMIELVQCMHSGMTPFQIEHFVLNDVEFPTDWGRLDQAKRELVARYDELVHLAFELKKSNIKIQKKLREADQAKDELDAELLRLEAQELQLTQERTKNRLAAVMREAAVFYSVYKSLAHIEALPPEEQARLEQEQWFAKCKNMPLIFEERYGPDFMKAALGDKYEAFLKLRRQGWGLLPREVTQAAEGKLNIPNTPTPELNGKRE